MSGHQAPAALLPFSLASKRAAAAWGDAAARWPVPALQLREPSAALAGQKVELETQFPLSAGDAPGLSSFLYSPAELIEASRSGWRPGSAQGALGQPSCGSPTRMVRKGLRCRSHGVSSRPPPQGPWHLQRWLCPKQVTLGSQFSAPTLLEVFILETNGTTWKAEGKDQDCPPALALLAEVNKQV